MKHVVTTYICDLCGTDLAGEDPSGRVALLHGADCDLCADCAKVHMPLVEKMAELVKKAANAANPYAAQAGLQAAWRQGQYGG